MPGGLAQPNTVDDRGVVKSVGDDGVLGTEELLEDSGVRVEAGGVENGVFSAEEERREERRERRREKRRGRES